MSIKSVVRIPWWAKVHIKVALSRVPVSYRFWQKLALFQHGHMEEPAYALKTFLTHFKSARLNFDSAGYTGLELGPGDTLFSALIGKCYGASRSILVDVGPWARMDIKPYREMASVLAAQGLNVPDLSRCANVKHILKVCNAQYLTDGLTSLRSIPSASVDYLFSNAVLEHVRKADFLDTMRELRRILKPTGVSSHQVDLRDHLGGALNNLRYPEERWEADWMARSGFYTNRIRFNEMLEMFEQAGFLVEIDHKDLWDQVPTSRSKMQPEFASLSDDDLKVMGFAVLLRPAPNHSI